MFNTICSVQDEYIEPSKVSIPSFRGTPLLQEPKPEANPIDVFPNLFFEMGIPMFSTLSFIPDVPHEQVHPIIP